MRYEISTFCISYLLLGFKYVIISLIMLLGIGYPMDIRYPWWV
jgi:hypothetical protein